MPWSWAQSTPPFYVLAVWGLAHLFGGSEAVLRSLSLVLGVGTVALFWFTARRLASLPAALLGSFLVAVSPVLVYFSKELKQYSADAFFAVLLVWLAEYAGGQAGSLVWVALALAGTLAWAFPMGPSLSSPYDPPGAVAQKGPVPTLTGGGPGGLLGLVRGGVLSGLFPRPQVSPHAAGLLVRRLSRISPGSCLVLAWFVGALGRYFHYFLRYFFYASWGWLWGAALSRRGLAGPMPAGAPASFGLLGRPSSSGLWRRGAAPLPLYGALWLCWQPPDALQRPHVLPASDCRRLT